MYCQRCGAQNSETSRFCAECSERLVTKKSFSWKWGIALIVLLAIGGAYYATSNDKPNVETAANSADRVTLIQEIQRGIFTVETPTGQGSGFLYASGGYVVTNAHVVKGVVDVTVRNSDGEQHNATVIGISDAYDIALLHVPHYAEHVPLVVETAESPVGLEVIAFGTPQGFENSASIGYITGHNRDFASDDFIYEQVYQVDAQIDKGSSGGALVDVTTGNVIGINSLLYTSETSTNFSFAIPLYTMMPYFDEWIAQPMSRDAVLQASGAYVQQTTTNEQLAGQFVQSFRTSYEQALNNSDFSLVSAMLTGSAYREINDYIFDLAYGGHVFEFLSNDVLSVMYDNNMYYVNMNETFYLYPLHGESQY
ncbi:MAG: trypsin-like peptidase domain-containing protein, partial [Caryophanon sp.]|nr:trypsin-like peptidase domain-containing protein [Caryophanon sp.]